MGLPKKQQIFVERYLSNGFNASEAARHAGYSLETAGAIGYNLLKNVEIKKAIAEGMRDRAMEADEVLARLAAHARGDMGEFIDNDGSINISKARAAQQLHLVKKITHTRRVHEGNETETVSIELYDAQNALATIAKHLGLLSDRAVNLNLTPEQLAQLSDDELRKLIDKR